MTWSPRPDRDDRRRSAVALTAAILDASPNLTTAHLREALSIAIWKYTEADGKWNTQYRTQAAIGAKSAALNHEHVVTRRALVAQMIANPDSCAEIMTAAIGCCVLRDEHRLLAKIEKAHPDAQGWDRYRLAGLVVIDQATGRAMDLAERGSGP